MFINFFRERGEGREKEWERETLTGCLSYVPPSGTKPSLVTCPEQESNQQPFALWDDAQPTEPHLSGLPHIF